MLSYATMTETSPSMPPRDNLGLDGPAWMLYTSGTTGQPKGVLSTQRDYLWSVAACTGPPSDCPKRTRCVPAAVVPCLAHVLGVVGVVAVGASAGLSTACRPRMCLAAWRVNRSRTWPAVRRCTTTWCGDRGRVAITAAADLHGPAVRSGRTELRRSVKPRWASP